MIPLTLQIVAALSAIAILCVAEPTLNRMGPATPILMRLAFYLMTVGSAAELISIVWGYVPTWEEVMPLIGIAVFLVADRRSPRPMPEIGHQA